MLSLDRSTLDALAVAGCAVGLLGLLTAVAAHLRLRRQQRLLLAVQGPDGQRDTLIAALGRQREEVDRLGERVLGAERQAAAARAELAASLRRVAVVRYDAFRDMGGLMSFSVALLDDTGDGLVLTSINGRTETRTYAKGVRAGRAEPVLSPEEVQAVTLARRGVPDGRAAGTAGTAGTTG